MSQSECLRVILIDDSISDSKRIEGELRNLSSLTSFKRVSHLDELVANLRSGSCHIILSEKEGETFSISSLLEFAQFHYASIPFIAISRSMSLDEAVEFMKNGGKNIVHKDRLEKLIPVIESELQETRLRHHEKEAQKLAEEAFAAKEQMLAIVSHDIKNPLFAIQLEAEMLLKASQRNEKSILGEEVRIQANRILKTSERMKCLISDLLDKNKSENSLSHLNKKDTDFLKVLNDALEAIRPLIQTKGILLKTVLPTNKVVLNIDRNKMFQVLSNLLNNAIKFTPKGGSILLELEDAPHDCIFSITDTGPGLFKGDLKKVFMKYWTSESECPGTGLGLFICKTVIEAHGGMISVENKEEGGACFRFHLPRVSNLSEAHFSYYEIQKDSRKKIYIVDDDEDLREVISWALGKEGHAIYSFQSPEEALNCLTLGRHLPHLIVVDYHMDEMQGSEFVLRKNEIKGAEDCPIVMISASPEEVERTIHSDHYKEVITKPIDLEGLVSNINKYLV